LYNVITCNFRVFCISIIGKIIDDKEMLLIDINVRKIFKFTRTHTHTHTHTPFLYKISNIYNILYYIFQS